MRLEVDSKKEASMAPRRVLFGRTGWMDYYNGPEHERPIGGGSFTKRGIGSEAYNFKYIHDTDRRFRGYIRGSVKEKCNLQRIQPGYIGDQLDGVTVIFCATVPQKYWDQLGRGMRIYGWYRDAVVHRMALEDLEHPHRLFNLEADSQESVLLPIPKRTLQIPGGNGGFGQFNMTYMFDRKGNLLGSNWMDEAIAFVDKYNSSNLLNSADAATTRDITDQIADCIERYEPNSKIRKTIETHAMQRAERYYTSLGYDVRNVSLTKSFDLLCTKNGKDVLVEVKGTRGPGNAILLTQREFMLASDPRNNTQLFVVHSIELDDNGKVVNRGKSVIYTPWCPDVQNSVPTHYLCNLLVSSGKPVTE